MPVLRTLDLGLMARLLLAASEERRGRPGGRQEESAAATATPLSLRLLEPKG